MRFKRWRSIRRDTCGSATQDGAAYYNGRVWTVVNMPNRDHFKFRSRYPCCERREYLVWKTGGWGFPFEGRQLDHGRREKWLA